MLRRLSIQRICRGTAQREQLTATFGIATELFQASWLPCMFIQRTGPNPARAGRPNPGAGAMRAMGRPHRDRAGTGKAALMSSPCPRHRRVCRCIAGPRDPHIKKPRRVAGVNMLFETSYGTTVPFTDTSIVCVTVPTVKNSLPVEANFPLPDHGITLTKIVQDGVGGVLHRTSQ